MPSKTGVYYSRHILQRIPDHRVGLTFNWLKKVWTFSYDYKAKQEVAQRLRDLPLDRWVEIGNEISAANAPKKKGSRR